VTVDQACVGDGNEDADGHESNDSEEWQPDEDYEAALDPSLPFSTRRKSWTRSLMWAVKELANVGVARPWQMDETEKQTAIAKFGARMNRLINEEMSSCSSDSTSISSAASSESASLLNIALKLPPRRQTERDRIQSECPSTLSWFVEYTIHLPSEEFKLDFERLVPRILEQLSTYPLKLPNNHCDRILYHLVCNVHADSFRPWHASILDCLLRRIAGDPSIMDIHSLKRGVWGHPTIVHVAPHGVVPFIRLLAQHGCALNEQDQSGRSALHHLCRWAPLPSIEAVFSDPSIPLDLFHRSRAGRTPRDDVRHALKLRRDMKLDKMLAQGHIASERLHLVAQLLRTKEQEWRICVRRHLKPYLIDDLLPLIISYVDGSGCSTPTATVTGS